MSFKIITVIQARTGSSRLPEKVLLSLCGQPLLLRQYERIAMASNVGDIVIATSINSNDDQIEKICKENNIICFRGDENDLLDRHYKAAVKYGADAIVKIPSDCPLIDPNIIDKVISKYLCEKESTDYVSNLHPATFPDGNDVEVFSFETLEYAWNAATKDFEREHTTPFIWENPTLFRIKNVEWESKLNYSTSHRWTIDYEEDYMFIRKIYEELYHKKPNFSLYDILNLLEEKPFIRDINKKYAGRYWYENHLSELKTIDEFKKNYRIAE